VGILDEDVQRVREATDVVDLVREHVALKRVGKRFVGLCPFHSEKTPSFGVNATMGTWYCFGCSKGGDAITFVRDVEHLDFVGAVERLAARAGIQLRYDDASFTKERQRRQRLHDAVEAAIAFYHDRLLRSDDGGRARQYLRSRSFDGEAARRFKLGYSPKGFDDLARHLQQTTKLSRNDLVDANLAFVNRAQKLQDVFRNRVMFPIWDARGDAVGFGARILDPDERGPKYKNTAETSIYKKSTLLYGLNWAKGEIVARGNVVICEGYTDVMAFHLAGVPQAVATCGTALADEHFLTLKNLARKITLAYDADAAGQAAAERCYQWEQRYEVQFQVADLPLGRDPGELWKDDRDRLTKAIEHAMPFLQFRLERVLGAADLTTIEGRARAGEAALQMIAEHPTDLVRDTYVMEIAGRLNLDVDHLRTEARRARQGARPALGASAGQRSRPDSTTEREQQRLIDRRELDALRWAVHEPALIGPHLDRALFNDPRVCAAFDALTAATTFAEAVDASDPQLAALLQRLAVEDIDAGDDVVAQIAARVVVNLVEASSQRLVASMLRSGDERCVEVKRLVDALVAHRDAGTWTEALPLADELVAWVAAENVGRDGD
jgi:DNA primase